MSEMMYHYINNNYLIYLISCKTINVVKQHYKYFTFVSKKVVIVEILLLHNNNVTNKKFTP